MFQYLCNTWVDKNIVFSKKRRYYLEDMVHFDEVKQNKQLKLLRKKEEERLIETLSKKYNIPYVLITPHLIDIEALPFIKESVARDAHVAVFGKGPKKQIKVAVFSPHNEKTEAALQMLQQKGFIVATYMASKESLEAVWKRYKEISQATHTDAGILDVTSEDVSVLMRGVTSSPAVTEKINELLRVKSSRKLSRLFELILSGAFAVKSSDVHMEPQEDTVRIRYRIDGVLQDICSIDPTLYRRMSTRIKLLSGLKLNVIKDTQDGRFSVKFKNTDIEIRTSVLPGQYGESIVLRILDPESISVPLEDLGINAHLLKILNKELSKPTGMILTTGPTGAGKTTTLYAFLRKTLQPNIKIITIEDPIEYHIKNIVQTQVSKKTNYTFLSGLRAALRQDPDIIMIGEIRDSETAKIAVNASLTGHLVFSSLHTNNAAGTIARLIDLGVNPKVLTSALNVSMAQRLVRKLCVHCRVSVEPTEEEKVFFEKAIHQIHEKQPEKDIVLGEIWKASDVGCEHCNSSGYSGRIGIYEAILMTSDMEDLLIENPSEKELLQITKKQGILDMKEDGIIKVLKGITSLEELARVVDIEEDL